MNFLLRHFEHYCQVAFSPVGDGVFVNPAPTADEVSRNAIRLACFENEWNHIHFETVIGVTMEERWRNNLALAQAVRAIWWNKLQVQFPERKFVLVIINEICEDGNAMVFAVQPTLKMWSGDNDQEKELWRAFDCDTDHCEDIMVERNQEIGFVPVRDFLRNLQLSSNR